MQGLYALDRRRQKEDACKNRASNTKSTHFVVGYAPESFVPESTHQYAGRPKGDAHVAPAGESNAMIIANFPSVETVIHIILNNVLSKYHSLRRKTFHFKKMLLWHFFFFYGGSLMDVASQTAWRNSPLSSACLPASTVETPIHSPMSCVHLLLGLPLPLLPSHVPSKNSFSNVLCRLMWPKYDSFCFLIRFRSCGAFTPSCSRTLAFVFLSVHEILSIFR